MDHVRKVCNCNRDHCNYCEGGLFTCSVCGASEGELTSECPGRQMTDEELQSAYAGRLDFYKGHKIEAESASKLRVLKLTFDVMIPKNMMHAKPGNQS